MAKQSLKQVAYNSIRDKILNCEYEPNSFLNEDMLCEEFQMSRTPIRDALSRMEQEHLIRIVPKKGFFVAPLSIDEINSVFEGRMLIEPYIVLNYCENLSEEILDRMEKDIERHKQYINDPGQTFYEIDNDFHQCMIAQCRNRYLLDTLSTIAAQNTRLRILSGRENVERRENTIAEHQAVYNALREHDAVKAAKALQGHLMIAKTAAFDTFRSSSSMPKML